MSLELKQAKTVTCTKLALLEKIMARSEKKKKTTLQHPRLHIESLFLLAALRLCMFGTGCPDGD